VVVSDAETRCGTSRRDRAVEPLSFLSSSIEVGIFRRLVIGRECPALSVMRAIVRRKCRIGSNVCARTRQPPTTRTTSATHKGPTGHRRSCRGTCRIRPGDGCRRFHRGRCSTPADGRQPRRLSWMRRFRMMVMQVRRQMVSNDGIPGHSRFEKCLLHVAGKVRPQCERRLPH
jgi:hypothetical protein